uniref:Unspecific monooxygenase n=1 Tax=Plectus sambesii TaxID=2011161 RepID=A0A914WU01_9BILA
MLDQAMGLESSTLFFVAGPISTKLPFIRSSWNRFKSCMGGIFDFIEENLAAHRTTFDPNEEPTDFAYAFLNKIHQLKQQGKSVENYSNQQFSNVAFDLWGAGLETTLTTLRWSILYMIHYPEVQEKIHQELDRVIGRDRDVIMADKPTLPYTMATINEIQRRANILPLNVPHTTTQEVTLAGFQIPKDTIIQPLISCLHMDEQYFPSPELFQPERFLNSDGSLKKIEQLVPFSLGKRQCMGESLARMELFLLFANFMHNFNVSAPTGKPLPTLKSIFGVILATILVVYLVDTFYWKRRKLPPGPTPLPIIGNLIPIIAAADPVDQFLIWKKQFGPVYTVWLGPYANVFVTDYDVMHDALVKQGDAYAGRMRNYAIDQVRGGNRGILLSEGNLWLEQRRFALHVLRDFGVGRSIMEDNILTEGKALVDGIREKLHKSGEPTEVEVTPLLSVCIGSIINALIFGYRFDNDKLEEFVQLRKLLDQGVSPEFQFLFFAAGPISTKLPFIRSSWSGFKSCMGGIFGFIEKNLAAHRTTFDSNEEPTDFAYAFLNKIHQLKQQGKSVENYSNKQFLNVAFDLWAAGFETTLTTLRWSILYMIHYPEVQEKIHQELDRVIGRDRDVIMADKPTLPYISATINEIQRRANILPLNVPHATTQEVMLAGFQIPKDTIIQPLISCVHRDEEYFPSPELFQPQRFLNSDGSSRKVEQLVPFSLGKRQCMGESLARMELFLLFANFMHNFNVSAPTGKPLPTLKPISGSTVSPHDHSCAISSRY